MPKMSVRRTYRSSGGNSSVSQFSADVESPADDSFTGYPGLPRLRMVGVFHPAFMARRRMASPAAAAAGEDSKDAAYCRGLTARNRDHRRSSGFGGPPPGPCQAVHPRPLVNIQWPAANRLQPFVFRLAPDCPGAGKCGRSPDLLHTTMTAFAGPSFL